MELHVDLDRAAATPLHRQLAEHLRRQILAGRLPAGARLPSTRQLADSLHLSRTVAVTAYDELIAEGYLETMHGSGTFVATAVRTAPVDGERPRPAAPPPYEPWPWNPVAPAAPARIEFRTGAATTTPLAAGAWRAIWARVGRSLPPGAYGPPAGIPELREAIAAYLRRARGLACLADDVTVTTGGVQAIDLLLRAALQPGDAVAVEEPGSPWARQILHARGARLVPVPVDGDGMRVDLLPTGQEAPALVYLTPSHQFPLGSRLPVGRRLALLDWARRHDRLVVEDDYDSEFRYGAAPLPALAGLDNGGHVAYVGTFSKVLTPALRGGYLVAPPPLRDRVQRLKPLTDYHTPWPVQRALAEFLDGGHLDRHLRKMRRHYAASRATLLTALAPVTELARPLGLEAGLHLCLELDPSLEPNAVAAEARRRGVGVAPLDACYLGSPTVRGLLLGYGGLTAGEIAEGAGILAQVITEAANRPGETGRAAETADRSL
jgi:GntR family transcriptional regulator / MocR family aminotransferase